MKRIGCNHTSNGWVLGGINSSFGGTFTDEEVLVESGIGDIVPCVMGDITDAYEMLKEELKKSDSDDFENVCNAVLRAVCSYFGDYSNVSSRMDFYTEDDFIASKDDIGKVSSLKGQNAAMCVERAMLSQNLLQSMGVESFFKCTGVINNGKNDIHAFNIVSFGDRYFIFDATIPAEKDGQMTPIITEIPKEVYEELKHPESSRGYSVVVSHYNPLRDKDVEMTYDANRKQVLDTTQKKTK